MFYQCFVRSLIESGQELTETINEMDYNAPDKNSQTERVHFLWLLLWTRIKFNPNMDFSNHMPSKVWGEITFYFQTSTAALLKFGMHK